MANIHSFKYFKYSLIILILYNIISLLVLFLPFKSFKYRLWQFTPYDYKYLLDYPNKLNKLSLLNSNNRDEILYVLKKNQSRNNLDIDYWNYSLIINNYNKDKNNYFEKSYINLFILTKNNELKNLDLKKFFISNYKYFTDDAKKYLINNY